MDLETFEKKYLKITARYAKLVGLWPFQSRLRQRIMHVCIIILVTLALVTQIARIVVYPSIEIVVDQVPFLMAAVATFIKSSNYMLNSDKFAKLFTSMLSDWEDQRTKEEALIMEKYANRGVFFILIYTINAYFCASVFILLPTMPYIMDTLYPLNESRPRIQMYDGYYFVEDQDRYYYEIMLYTALSLLTAMCVFISSDTTLVYVVQHSCALLALAGHRFKCSMDEARRSTVASRKDTKTAYENVCKAVTIHKRSLAFLIEIENAYAMNLFIQVGVVVLSFTITLLKVATIAFSMDTYPYYGYLIAQLVHICFLTIQGQFVIDLHDSIYRKGYESYWYNGDVRTQALYILIQRQNLTPPLLTAGGLLQLNLDSFAEIVKACVSYFTVLKSV